jgi:hypothetical protein
MSVYLPEGNSVKHVAIWSRIETESCALGQTADFFPCFGASSFSKNLASYLWGFIGPFKVLVSLELTRLGFITR